VRLHRAGFPVVILEMPQPLAVRRLVALAEAVYAGRVEVEGVDGKLAASVADVPAMLEARLVPILIDTEARSLAELRPAVIVDGRMRKRPSDLAPDAAGLIIGLGPGFVAGADCHAAIETQRGHHLGRVVWHGQTSQDTRIPDAVEGYAVDRVLRAPRPGVMQGRVEIGSLVRMGDVLAVIDGDTVTAPFDGALRGLLHDGVPVERGMKLGDLDPRREPSYCREISEKALAVGGGVLEAVLSRPDIRRSLAG
jgi:xanthine dehydrogenase accessory factor